MLVDHNCYCRMNRRSGISVNGETDSCYTTDKTPVQAGPVLSLRLCGVPCTRRWKAYAQSVTDTPIPPISIPPWQAGASFDAVRRFRKVRDSRQQGANPVERSDMG
jgi:hypothetical protein